MPGRGYVSSLDSFLVSRDIMDFLLQISDFKGALSHYLVTFFKAIRCPRID